MDMLKTIMEKQRELQTRLGTNFAALTDEERAAFMRDHRGYMEDEIAEALYEMPNYKSWKDYSGMSPEKREVQWQKVRMELIDALHFFTNLLLAAGFTAEEVCYMYMEKNKENHERQDRGYSDDVSYREQGVDEVIKPHCIVNMGERSYEAENFIAMLTDGEANSCLMMNSDTVALGTMANILSEIYYRDLQELTPEDAVAIEHEVNTAVGSYWEANKDE